MAHPAQAQRDRDLTRHHAADADGDRVRRHVTAARGEEVFMLLLADVDAAATAANEHAGAGLPGAQARVAPGFSRGDDAEERRARVCFGSASIVIVVTIELWRVGNRHQWDPRRNLAGIARDVELRDCARAAAAAAHVLPEPLAPDTERRHHTDAANGDEAARWRA